MLVCECCEQVNVVWHHNKVGQHVAITVEVQQAISDDLCKLRIPQHTIAMALIQFVMPTRRESTLELMLF